MVYHYSGSLCVVGTGLHARAGRANAEAVGVSLHVESVHFLSSSVRSVYFQSCCVILTSPTDFTDDG